MLTRQEARSFYDRFGAKQDTQAFYEDRAIRALITHARFEAATAVFEFGCGTGRVAAELLTGHLPRTATYAGCDISATMIDLARRRLAGFGARATVHRTDGATTVDAPDASYDRFLSTYVLDLLPPEDIHGVLAEAHRVLAADGLLCLVGLTHGVSPLSRLLIAIWTRLHHLRPSLVGGCRPVVLLDYVSDRNWQIEHQSVCVAFGVPSEVLVARKRGAAAAT